MKTQNFIYDQLEEKPKLHMLYTKWAVEHLTAIDNFIQRLSDFANIDMLECIYAVQKQRKKLCDENRAYYDANEIIESIKKENEISNHETDN